MLHSDYPTRYLTFRRASAAVLSITFVLSALLVAYAQSSANTPDDHPAFWQTWSRTDKPVADGDVHRTWMWGPENDSELRVEEYQESPDGWRTVRYFHKSRMEINDPGLDPNHPWFVTNGLLARDLILGQVQVGDDAFEYYDPPEINIAGDPDDPTSPTYQTFHGVMQSEPLPLGSTVVQTIDREGNVGADDSLGAHEVTVGHVEPATNHSVTSVFWDFMHSSGMVFQEGEITNGLLFQNPYYATGYPLTEPYWTYVSVAGEQQMVLVQVFERRVLTYTPGNPAGWQVESGNAGLHYQHWYYDVIPAQTSDPTVDQPEDSSPADPGTGEDQSESGPSNTPTPTPVPDQQDPSTSQPSPTPTPTPAPQPSPTPTPAPQPPSQGEAACLDTHEQSFLALINNYRQENGVAPLQNSQALNVASFKHSKDMGERGYFNHVTPEGVTPWDRMAAEGYTYNTKKAENIAAGQQTAQQVFNAWRNSPGHNQNMLDPGLRVIGIGRAEVPGSQYGVYWTTKFGGHVDAAPNC